MKALKTCFNERSEARRKLIERFSQPYSNVGNDPGLENLRVKCRVWFKRFHNSNYETLTHAI